MEFFVSYYDYYQPEAYVPRTDTFIEKDSSVNEEIDRLRHAATSSLLTHRDTIVVASVSCIYGLGSPVEYRERMLQLEVGDSFDQRALLRRLVEMQYNRNELVLERGTFRMKGDTLEIQPAYSNEAIRVSFFENVIEEVSFFNPVTQESRGKVKEFTLFAASHYATSNATLQRAFARSKRNCRANSRSSSPKASSSRPSVCARAPNTISRCSSRPASAPVSRTTAPTSTDESRGSVPLPCSTTSRRTTS